LHFSLELNFLYPNASFLYNNYVWENWIAVDSISAGCERLPAPGVGQNTNLKTIPRGRYGGLRSCGVSGDHGRGGNSRGGDPRLSIVVTLHQTSQKQEEILILFYCEANCILIWNVISLKGEGRWSVFRNASDLIMKVSRLLTCFFPNHSDVYLYVYICVQLLLFLILYCYSFIWLHWKQLLNPFNFVISYGPRNIMKIFLN